MKAIVLSAGQGRRLLPLTEATPKCLLPVGGRTILEWQLAALARCGVEAATVVVGFGAAEVEARLDAWPPPLRPRALFNPFFPVADNLASCWMARTEMAGDFLLLNGDTLFEPAVVGRLLEAPARPVTLAVDHKAAYDDDDMKVSLDGPRLLRVGKQLPPAAVSGESIGVMLFRGEGAALFRAAVERALRRPEALRRWYLSVIDEMAGAGQAWVASIRGLAWAEVDCAADLERAAAVVARWAPELAGTDGAPAHREPAAPSTTPRTSLRSSGVSTSMAASGNGTVTARTRTPSRAEARSAPAASESDPSA